MTAILKLVGAAASLFEISDSCLEFVLELDVFEM